MVVNTKSQNTNPESSSTPTVLDDLPYNSQLPTRTLRSVLSLVHANFIDEAMEVSAAILLATRPRFSPPAVRPPAKSATKPLGERRSYRRRRTMDYFPQRLERKSFFGIFTPRGRGRRHFTESNIVVERWSRRKTRKF